jgi:hypothetical protein
MMASVDFKSATVMVSDKAAAAESTAKEVRYTKRIDHDVVTGCFFFSQDKLVLTAEDGGRLSSMGVQILDAQTAEWLEVDRRDGKVWCVHRSEIARRAGKSEREVMDLKPDQRLMVLKTFACIVDAVAGEQQQKQKGKEYKFIDMLCACGDCSTDLVKPQRWSSNWVEIPDTDQRPVPVELFWLAKKVFGGSQKKALAALREKRLVVIENGFHTYASDWAGLGPLPTGVSIIRYTPTLGSVRLLPSMQEMRDFVSKFFLASKR